MHVITPRLARILTLVALATLTLTAVAPAGSHDLRAAPAATRLAAPDTPLARYDSAAYGYSLHYPASWARLTNVRWTPGGPAADLTLIQPDHEAAIGVLVTPAGTMRYSDAALRGVADAFIAQQDTAQGDQTRHATTVLGGVRYVTAVATFRHGGETQADSWMVVLVANSHHRLYLFAGLVYDCAIHIPPAGSRGNGDATETPSETATDVPLQGSGVALAAVSSLTQAGIAHPGDGLPASTATPFPNAAARSVSPAIRSTRPAASILSGLGTGGGCAGMALSGIEVLDANPIFGPDRLLIAGSLDTLRIDPRAADDRRPPAGVSVDGFATFHDAPSGLAIRYPAHWARSHNTGTVLSAQAPDGKALLYVAVQPAGTTGYTAADLQTIGDRTIYQFGQVLGTIDHRSAGQPGTRTAVSDTQRLQVSDGKGGTAQARATVLVGVFHRRIYAALSVVLHITSAPGDSGDVRPAFFAPFDPSARIRGRTNFDEHNVAQQLALASLNTLDVDPGVPSETRPAPAVGIDGFTRHSSATYGYAIEYPSGWGYAPGAGTDLSVTAPDTHVYLAVAVQPTGRKQYAMADLQAVATREIGQIGQGGTAKSSTIHSQGNTYLLVSVADLTTKLPGFNSITSDVVALLTVQHRRIYAALGWVYQFSTTPGSLDYTIAKKNEQLVLASLQSLTIDPHAPDDTRNAPATGVDGFAEHSSASHRYALRYPASWQPIANSQADFSVLSPDKRAALLVSVAPLGAGGSGATAVQGAADALIRRLGQVGLEGIAHQTVQVNGVTYYAASASVSPVNGGLAAVGYESDVLELATARNGRLYLFLGLVNRSKGAGDDNAQHDTELSAIRSSLQTITLR